MAFGLPQVLDIKAILTLIPLSLIGFTIAAAQFNLFEVEKWWFKIWFWLFSGLAIIGMDLLLVFFLDFNKITALGITLILAGFVYFPVRQWILKRITPINNQPLEHYLPTFISTVSEHVTADGFNQSWLQVLKDRFEPMNATWKSDLSQIKIENHGFSICIPDIENKGHYQLSGKHLGNKLFNKDDISLIKNLFKLMHLIEHTSNTKQELIQVERKRIMQDMHDTVGSNLLSLSQRIQDPTEAEYITATLQTLRDTVHFSTSETPLWLEDVLADLRVEIVERCELANIELTWQSESLPNKEILPINHSIILINIFREAISNALRHASPSKIGIELSHNNNVLHIIIRNNGKFTNLKEWKNGSGLNGMKERTEKLRGKFLVGVEKDCVVLRIELPLV